MTVRSRVERVRAADGRWLAVTFHEPADRAATATCLVAPAMGVRRTFYDGFARWLAGRGVAAAVLDYRGTGGSRPLRLEAMEARLPDLARLDLPAAGERLAERHPDRPRTYVGHSLGAQLFGLLPEPNRYRRMLMVASGSAHWRLWPVPDRWAVAAMWYVVVPLLTRTYGHFPARLVGMGDELPAGVARDWARWARHPAYAVDEKGRPLREGFRSYRGKIRAVNFTDDPFAPRPSAEELLGFWERADRELLHRSPDEVGRETVGHMGFFRPESREPLWRESAAWLLSSAGECG